MAKELLNGKTKQYEFSPISYFIQLTPPFLHRVPLTALFSLPTVPSFVHSGLNRPWRNVTLDHRKLFSILGSKIYFSLITTNPAMHCIIMRQKSKLAFPFTDNIPIIIGPAFNYPLKRRYILLSH